MENLSYSLLQMHTVDIWGEKMVFWLMETEWISNEDQKAWYLRKTVTDSLWDIEFIQGERVGKVGDNAPMGGLQIQAKKQWIYSITSIGSWTSWVFKRVCAHTTGREEWERAMISNCLSDSRDRAFEDCDYTAGGHGQSWAPGEFICQYFIKYSEDPKLEEMVMFLKCHNQGLQ